jgi:predicted O-methyltransferase YrrM
MHEMRARPYDPAMPSPKELYYRLTSRADRAKALARLATLERRLPSPPSRFAIPFVFRGAGHYRSIRPRQNPVEIESLYALVCAMKPQRVLEIGTAKGGTLYLWAQAAADTATIVSVDMPGGRFGGGYPLDRVPLYQAFARAEQTLVLLREDSHADATLERVRGLFDGGPIDFAFIDGDHTYDGVRSDFARYAPLVRPGGCIGFHDIRPQPDSPDTQVHRLWDELSASPLETIEFVAPDDTRPIGIGVVRVPDEGIDGPCDLLTDAPRGAMAAQ